jgi:hypothetical protein
MKQLPGPVLLSSVPSPLILSSSPSSSVPSSFDNSNISSRIVSKSSLPFSVSASNVPKVFNLGEMNGNLSTDYSSSGLSNDNTFDIFPDASLSGNVVDKKSDMNDSVISNVLSNNSSSSQSSILKDLVQLPRRVRCKQVDLLPPEYLTAKLNNERVVNIKHPSLLPRSKPDRNPSQVFSSDL